MTDQATTIDLQHELTNGFAGRFIRSKAKRLVGHQRLTQDDRLDIEQELMVTVFKAFPKFDPSVAPWRAFVSTVVERQAGKILRNRKTQKRKPDCNPVSLSTLVQDADGELVPLATQIGKEHRESMTGRYCADELDLVDLRIDVAEVIARLPADLRDLCRRLMQKSLTEISAEMQIPRTTLWERVLELRARFEEVGLKDFFQKSSDSSDPNREV